VEIWGKSAIYDPVWLQRKENWSELPPIVIRSIGQQHWLTILLNFSYTRRATKWHIRGWDK
jgi:hypothetical protein